MEKIRQVKSVVVAIEGVRIWITVPEEFHPEDEWERHIRMKNGEKGGGMEAAAL